MAVLSSVGRSAGVRYGAQETDVMAVRFVVEQHPEGFVAYPLGVEGAVIGEGDTAAEALADCRSALAFHVETFGAEVLQGAEPILDAYLVEAEPA
jgi:hypothetical protein